MRLRCSSFVVSAIVAAGMAAPADAQPKRGVVDRIVAVVDEECITHREVDREAAPKIEQLVGTPPQAAKSDSAERQARIAAIRREALGRLIEERLFARAADRRSIRVTSSEIDAALDKVAAEQKSTRAEVLKAAAARGWSDAAYRARIGRQLLEAKVLAIELAAREPRFKGSDAERAGRLAELRKTIVAELRATAYVEEKL